jgi:hypothetical protein
MIDGMSMVNVIFPIGEDLGSKLVPKSSIGDE